MFENFTKPRRVVITGFGCVTPIGIGREDFWKSLRMGKSGVSQIESFDTADTKVKIAAEVKDFDWEAELNPKDRKHVARTVPLALRAAREAVADAQIEFENLTLCERQNFGVILGTGGGGLAFTERQYRYWFTGEEKRRAFTRFRLRRTAVCRRNSRWFSDCTDSRTSFRPAARVRPTRCFTPRRTSRSAGRILC